MYDLPLSEGIFYHCFLQVGMDRVVNDDTRLLYVTTGVLLQKLINTKNMQQYTHVILDEASTQCNITYTHSEILGEICKISEIN